MKKNTATKPAAVTPVVNPAVNGSVSSRVGTITNIGLGLNLTSSGAKINKYDKTWIISNFNDQEYLNDIEKEVKKSKEDFKKEIKPLLIIFAIGFISLFILFLIIFYFVRF